MTKHLKKEFKEKKSSVETDLGRDNHGRLGLVLTGNEHAIVPHTQLFMTPNYARLLVIPHESTPIVALELKYINAEAKRL